MVESGWVEVVLIVDKHNDLNIYKERLQDEEKSSCCGNFAPNDGTGCCSTGKLKEKTAERVAGIDFNDWVSFYSIYAVKPSKLSLSANT